MNKNNEAVREIGRKGRTIPDIFFRTLRQIKWKKQSYRNAYRDVSHDRSIRFITSDYVELFRIPSGGKVRIDYPDQSYIAPCEYIDDYHTRIGTETFHTCQFAEFLERGGGKVVPEPEILQEQAAWQIGYKEYLSIRYTEPGWNYTVYDKDFEEIDEGQIDLQSITIQDCRDMILADFGWQSRIFCQVDWNMVENRTADVVEKHLNSALNQLHSKSAVKANASEEKAEAVPLKLKHQKEECL